MSETAQITEVPVEAGTLEVKEEKLSWREKRRRKKSDNQRFTKKKRPIGKILLVLILIGGAVFIGYKMTHKGPTGTPVTTVPITKGDLVNAVNLTGVAESAEDAQVYAKGTGTIDVVNVKKGDKVEAGQVLAQLDTRDAKLSIAQRQAEIEKSKRNAEFMVDVRKDDFNDSRVDVAAGLNNDLIMAENEVDRAQKVLNAARHDFNEVKDAHEVEDLMFKKAQKELERASDKYWEASEKLQHAQTSGMSSEEIAELQDKFNEAESALEDAHDKYNAFDREYGKEMSAEAKAYRNARSDYEKALKQRDIAKNAVARDLEGKQKNIAEAELNLDFTADYLAIQQLQEQIADSVVTAPISGTVTVVNAQEGASSAGLLFIIEDTEKLVVNTAVKEMEVSKVKPGMKAEVKADATGEKVFPAHVQEISPTATKDEKGETVKTGNVEFDTKVSLDNADPDLRVGMNVRVNVVLEEKKGVWYVPFDAVAGDAEGNSIIYVLETDAEGVSKAKAIPVTTGMETDFYIEISGDGLSEDMKIISDPSMIQDGMQVLDTTAAVGMMAGAAMAG